MPFDRFYPWTPLAVDRARALFNFDSDSRRRDRARPARTSSSLISESFLNGSLQDSPLGAREIAMLSDTRPLSDLVVDVGGVTNDIHAAMQGMVFLGTHQPSGQAFAVKVSLLTTNKRTCSERVDTKECATRALADVHGDFQVETVIAALMNEMAAARTTPAATRTLLSVPVLLRTPVWDYKAWLRRQRHRAPESSRSASARTVALPGLISDDRAGGESQDVMQALVDARISAMLEKERESRRGIMRDVSASYDRLESIEVVGDADLEAYGILDRIQSKLARLETNTMRNEVVVGMNVMIQERLQGTLKDLFSNTFEMLDRRQISTHTARRILHALVAQQLLALAAFRSAFAMVHADAHSQNWMHARVHASSQLHFRDLATRRLVLIPTFGAVLKLIDFGQSACLVQDSRGDRVLVVGRENAWNPHILDRQDDLLRVMEVLFDPRVRRLILSSDRCPHAQAFRRILTDVLESWTHDRSNLTTAAASPATDFASHIRSTIRRGDRDAYNRDLLGFGASAIYPLVERARIVCPKLTTDFILRPGDQNGAGFLDVFTTSDDGRSKLQPGEFRIHRA